MTRSKKDFEAQALIHIDALYRSAVHMTGNQQDAEDLVQDVYVQAIRFYQQFQLGTNLRAWLFKILKNTYINQFRKHARTPNTVGIDEPEFHRYELDAVVQSHLRQEPETDFLNRRTSEEIKNALSSLPEKSQRVVILSDVEGFSYKEIADIEDCPLGTVMSRLYRARRMLRGILSTYDNSG